MTLLLILPERLLFYSPLFNCHRHISNQRPIECILQFKCWGKIGVGSGHLRGSLCERDFSFPMIGEVGGGGCCHVDSDST